MLMGARPFFFFFFFFFFAALGCSGGPSMSGAVIIERTAPAQTYAVGTLFWNGTPTEGYDVTTIGPCTVLTVSPGSDAGVVPISAGAVSFSASPSGVSLELTTMPNAQAVKFQPLDTVTVSASGGAFPAFSAAVQLPTAMSVTSPALPVAGSFPLDRSSDFVITHTTEASGQFFVEFRQEPPAVTSVIDLMCRYAGTDATATVPAAALAHLSATTSSPTTTFFGTVVEVDASAGGGAMVQLLARDDVEASANVQ